MNCWSNLLIVFCLCFSSVHGFSQSRREQQVEQLAREFVACFNKPDATSFEFMEGLLVDDFIQVTSSGKVIVGKQANLRMYREAREEIDQNFDHLRFDFDVQSVKVLRRKTAVVFGVAECRGALQGGQVFERQIHETLVFTRIGKKWRLTHEHSSRIE